jgi:hypothetical protein
LESPKPNLNCIDFVRKGILKLGSKNDKTKLEEIIRGNHRQSTRVEQQQLHDNVDTQAFTTEMRPIKKNRSCR